MENPALARRAAELAARYGVQVLDIHLASSFSVLASAAQVARMAYEPEIDSIVKNFACPVP
ncbi:hypothetical protein ACI3L1_00850 [Deinococcus sp. SM5_A1]|uniref:hypothetical protein n=1 Tax=Deinococcus sp. SM5_A1 TaxID=3379094 RepID=UPI0038599753